MKIRLQYDKKNNIRLLAALCFAAAMYFMAGIALWIIPVFGAAYYLLKSLDIELSPKLPWLWSVILIGGSSTVTMFMIQYVILEPDVFMRTSDEKLFLNVLCIAIFYLVIQLFTNNTGLTCVIAHISMLSFGFVDYFVYLFRQNEFTFSDIRSIGTGLSVAGNYQFRIHDRGAYAILGSILLIALIRKCHVSFRSRIGMSVVSVLLGAVMTVCVAANSMYVNTETWEQKGTYRNGYILNFVLGVRDSFVSAPDGYSEDAVAELEKEYSGNGSSYSGDYGLTKKPTIIAIMNESFADLSVLGDLKTNEELTPFMDSMQENTVKGYALSSVFGAKTPNSEWEFMTGNSMAFLPSGSVVYQQYINQTPASIVTTLKDIGYTCVAMHPYYETGWSRNQVYPKLGFDETHFIDDFDQNNIIREYITDQEMYNKIIDRYESKAANENLFIMGITMQNHGGYTDTYSNFPEEIYKTGRSYTDVNQYLSLVHESDKAIQNLITYFEHVDDPVEIVFFGDHQPSLNSAFYEMMNGKGLSNLTMEELEDLYKVPFFIWTNYDSTEKTVDITSLDFLSTMALEQAGIDLPAYNQFLADMMEEVPAINSRGYYSKSEGAFLHLDEAEGEEAEWIQNYNILQYNSMFDKKNRSDLFFPYYK